MKFYKAIEKTDTFSEYGDVLIPEDVVAFRMTNAERKEIRDATVQEIVKEIRDSSEWDKDLVSALCTFANMDEEFENAENLEDVVYKAAGELNIDIDDLYESIQPETEEKITVLLLEPDQSARLIELDNSLESMQKTVGGNIEIIYPFADDACIVCNEEGKLLSLPLNRALYDEDDKIYDVIAGTAFICGIDDENFISLSEEQKQRYTKKFEQPERFYITEDKDVKSIKPKQSKMDR